MKWHDYSKTSFVLIAFIAAFMISANQANADFTFGELVNLESVIPVLDPVHESINCFSSDGLEMYIGSDRPGGQGDYDLWVLRRTSIDDDWGSPENLGPAVNGLNSDAMPSVSADGLTLCFNSNRPGGYGRFDIWMITRATKNDPWGAAVNLGPKVNSSSSDADPWISADGLELYFSSKRPGGYGDFDIYVTRRTTQDEPWADAVNLGPTVNSAYGDGIPYVSPDGLILFFADIYYCPVRPGGYGGADMWITRRATLSDPWQEPVNLGSKVNSAAHDFLSRLSPDGQTLYFCTERDGTYDNWQSAIIIIVDFNGDGKVDLKDFSKLAQSWGQDDSSVDIGPMAWGDGRVDIQNLAVLVEYWLSEF